jgi:flagellar motor switch protein FliG
MAEAQALSGLQKAAILLLALGKEASAQLVSGLSPSDIELLAGQIARTKNIDSETRSRVLQEFQTSLSSDQPAPGGMDYARELLTQTLGEERASSVMSRLEYTSDSAGFTVEGEKEADRLGRLLRHEHPQIAAAVLAQMPPALAGRALGGLSKDGQLEVSLRLLDMDPPDPRALRRVGQALRTGIISEQPVVLTTTDGTRRLAEILNSADWEIEQRVITAINDVDPNLCQQIREKMFVFDDLIELDPRDLQLVLRGVSQDDLRQALHAASERLKEFILANMSERAAAALKEDMETAGEVKPKQARAAQQRIAAVARGLAQEGVMTLRKSGEESAETPGEGGEDESGGSEPPAPAAEGTGNGNG